MTFDNISDTLDSILENHTLDVELESVPVAAYRAYYESIAEPASFNEDSILYWAGQVHREYVGKYESIEAFAEEYTLGLVIIPEWLNSHIDYESVWNDELSGRYDYEDGFIFDENP